MGMTVCFLGAVMSINIRFQQVGTLVILKPEFQSVCVFQCKLLFRPGNARLPLSFESSFNIFNCTNNSLTYLSVCTYPVCPTGLGVLQRSVLSHLLTSLSNDSPGESSSTCETLCVLHRRRVCCTCSCHQAPAQPWPEGPLLFLSI